MKITMPVSALKQALTTVLPFRQQRSSALPILANVRLMAAAGELFVSATNLEAGITLRAPCTTEEFGATCVHAEALAKIVGMLEGEYVTLEADHATTYLRISSGSYRGKLVTTPDDQFPIVPDVIDEDAFDAPTNLVAALTAVAKTASKDESRPTLTCIKVTVGDGNLQLVSTDGYRLTRVTLPTPANPETPDLTLLVPVKTIEALTRIAKGAQSVRLCVTEDKFTAEVAVDDQTAVITCITMDARFPDYQAIIPVTHNSRAKVKASPLVRATKMALLTGVDANVVGYAFGADQVAVSAKSDTQEASIELPATLAGEPITMHFNGNYLMEALAAFNGDEVVLEMTVPTRPAVIYAEPAGKEAHMALVMPMHPPQAGQVDNRQPGAGKPEQPSAKDEEPAEEEPVQVDDSVEEELAQEYA